MAGSILPKDPLEVVPVGAGVEEAGGVGTVWVAVGISVTVGETTGEAVGLGTAVTVGEPPFNEKLHQAPLSR